MAQEVTLSEIAKLLDLSISTVSKSLSNSHEISANTKRRVQQTAKAMCYKPNYYASKLRTGESRTIGVVLPTVLNPYYAKLLTGIEHELTKQNYKMITLFSNDSHKREVDCLSSLMDGSVDGIIICIARETQIKNSKEHLSRKLIGIPSVYVDRLDNELIADQVVSDDFEASYAACKKMTERTASNKVIFISLMGALTIEELRYDGYCKAMNSFGFKDSITAVRTSNKHVLKKELELLIKRHKVDAILCANGSTTKVVLDILWRKKEINHNIHVIGFCSEHIRTISKYPFLSIIDQYPKDLGKKATITLLKRISEEMCVLPRIYQVKSKLL